MHLDWEALAISSGLLIAAAGLGTWLTTAAERRLRLRAEDLGLTILERRPARYLRGPFTWTASRADFVHRVTVRDAGGVIRDGWVRVPWLFMGPSRAAVEARWIEAKPPHA